MRRSLLAWIVMTVPCVAFAQDSVLASDAAVPEVALHVEEVVVCRAVQDRTPVDPAEDFGSEVGSLYCFTKLTGAREPVQTYHRWYVGDTMVREIPITVKMSPYRCWSVKSIQPDWSGACRVDVVSEGGDVLGSKTFTLTSGAPAQPQG